MRDLEKVTFMLENFQNIMLDVPKQDWTLKELLDVYKKFAADKTDTKGIVLDYDEKSKRIYAPGDWVEEDVLGAELTFEEIAHMVGQQIIMDKSTSSHKWYKVVKVEKIVMVENNTVRRLVYYDGHRDRGLVNETYFSPDYQGWKSHAYRIKESEE